MGNRDRKWGWVGWAVIHVLISRGAEMRETFVAAQQGTEAEGALGLIVSGEFEPCALSNLKPPRRSEWEREEA